MNSPRDGWTPDDIQRITANPIYAISISPNLAIEHEPLISEGKWIAANAQLIKELGAEKYLWLLLDVLKGKFV